MKPGLRIKVTERGVVEVRLGKREARPQGGTRSVSRRWEEAARKELAAYFAGRLHTFTIPCDLTALSPFTQAVLRATSRIPHGEVRSYRWVAERLKKPRATRAVGNALARNPVPIIIPCHRVVRSDGTLGGFALGLKWKKRLLELENRRRGRSAGV
ncbi:MAG: methylated-DNA--[protein]-cysteine S-methyltransferase [Candidatus Binatia bacterium]